MRIRTLVLLLSILILFSSCALPGRKDDPVSSHKSYSTAVGLSDKAHVRMLLYRQHREWNGVEYRIGGLNKSGVDCSGFVYLTFKSRFNVVLPRTTKDQIKLGKPVKKAKLKAGDLVFFKTRRKVRHVGIYIEDGKFLHASTNNGVMISRLDNVYWKKKYWKARRVRK
jgi:cell wall-associated NlpC family hydrolase